MILVDSCVWIDLLKGKSTPQVEYIQNISLTLSHEICINNIIFFEVLRGIRSDKERRKVKNIFNKFEFYNHLDKGFEELVEIYRLCQKKGFTLSKLGDWLIFKSVMDHSLELLTSDDDFKKLNKIYPFPLIS